MSGGSETIVNKSNSSHTVSESSPRVAGLTIQTASYGLTIPIIYGRTRMGANLIWVGNFLTQSYTETRVTSSTPETVTTTDGGKFGKSTTTITPASESTESTITYVYFASPIFCLGEGPIAGVNGIWREKTKLPGNGWGEFYTKLGSIGQPALGFMGDQTVAYSGLALCYADNTEMTSGGGMPAFAFEVDGKLQIGGGIVDASPALILQDLCTHPAYGAGFPGDIFQDLALYNNYCYALSLFVSPAYDSQRGMGEILMEMLQMTNSTVVLSQGKLKIIPYGDETLSGNGAIYNPNTTPVYDLDDNDFLDNGSAGPVKCTRRTPADSFNTVRIEYLDRTQDYALAIAEAFDAAHIEANGVLLMESIKCTAITSAALARQVAQILLQRNLYVKNEYEFNLGWNYALLEPMDLVTLTDVGLGLNKTPVRIISIDETSLGELAIVAEDYPFGVSSSAQYPDHPGLATKPDYSVAPGNVSMPIFLEPPIELAGRTFINVLAAVTGSHVSWGGCQVWFSLDGDEYTRIGTVRGGALYGPTKTDFLTSSNTVDVQLMGRGGVINNVPLQDAQNLSSLCWIGGADANDGGEFFGFVGASLTGVNTYQLSGLIRGAYDSKVTDKPRGRPFVRLDKSVVSTGPLQTSLIGKQVFFKFTSFNIYGGGQQNLADVTEYPYIITGAMALLPPPSVQSFDIIGNSLVWTASTARDVAGYVLRFNYGTNPAWGTATPINTGLVTQSPFDWTLRPSGPVTVLIRAVDQFGNLSAVASAIYTNLGDPAIANVVELISFSNLFLGTATGADIIAGALVGVAPRGFYPDDNQPMYPSDALPFYQETVYGGMVYETNWVYVGGALAGSLATLLLDYSGTGLMIEYRTSAPEPMFGGDTDEAFWQPDADPFYGTEPAWQPWPGQVTAKNDIYQFRVSLGAGAVRPVIRFMALVIDALDIEENISNLPLAIGGTAIPYTKAFTVIKGIQATLQAGVSGAVNILTTKTNNLAPVATAVNSSVVAVAGATGDFTLKGY